MKVRQRWEAVASSQNNTATATTAPTSSTTTTTTTTNNNQASVAKVTGLASTTEASGTKMRGGVEGGVEGGGEGGVGRTRGGGPRRVLRRELFVISGEVVSGGGATNSNQHKNNATTATVTGASVHRHAHTPLILPPTLMSLSTSYPPLLFFYATHANISFFSVLYTPPPPHHTHTHTHTSTPKTHLPTHSIIPGQACCGSKNSFAHLPTSRHGMLSQHHTR